MPSSLIQPVLSLYNSIHVISHQVWTCKEMSRKASPLSARPGKVVLLVQSTDGGLRVGEVMQTSTDFGFRVALFPMNG